MTNTSVDSSVVQAAIDRLETFYAVCIEENDKAHIREVILILKKGIVGEDYSIQPKKSAGRRKSDPAHDAEIADMHAKGATLDELAEKEGISRQAICKALNRAKAHEIEINTPTQSKSGEPYSPSNDQLRAAGVLLFGKRVGNNIEDIKEYIKKELK